MFDVGRTTYFKSKISIQICRHIVPSFTDAESLRASFDRYTTLVKLVQGLDNIFAHFYFLNIMSAVVLSCLKVDLCELLFSAPAPCTRIPPKLGQLLYLGGDTRI